jgi:hypothetical protein
MKRMGILIAAVILLNTLPLSSQQVEASYEFGQALQQMLKAEGWSSEEIQKLLEEEVDWEQARIRDAQVIAICLTYAKDADGEIGPYEQAQMAMEVMTVAREMRAFGFGEPEILRTSLNGTRGVLGDLEKLREQERLRIGEDNGIGELIRSRFQEQLQTAMNLEARHMVQARVRAEKNSRPGDLLVPPGPQGPGGSAR